MQIVLDDIYFGSIESRLDVGRTLFHHIGEQLREDHAFQRQFVTLTEYVLAVNEQMSKMGLGPFCTSCSALPSGGCCSLAIAAETDAVQICMNLLAGVNVHSVQNNGNECVFLGSTGCIFIFKPIFCLNYICSKIKNSVAVEDLMELERLTGRLLTQQYEIEKFILRQI